MTHANAWTRPGPLLLLIGGLWLTGCATAPSSIVAPAVPDYTPEFQERAATEIEALPPGSALLTMILDYGRLRAQIRALP